MKSNVQRCLCMFFSIVKKTCSQGALGKGLISDTWNGCQTAATAMLTSWVGKVNRIIKSQNTMAENIFNIFHWYSIHWEPVQTHENWLGQWHVTWWQQAIIWTNIYSFVHSMSGILKMLICIFFRFQFQFGGSWAPRHSDTDPTSAVTEVILKSGEILTGVNYWTGNLVDALEFVTNIKTYAKVGGGGGGSGSVSGVEVKFFMGDIKDGFITNLKPLFAECWNNKDIAILLHKNALHSELGLNYFTLFTY